MRSSLMGISTNANFSGANLTDALFSNVNLDGAVFDNATIKSIEFKNVYLKEAICNKYDVTGIVLRWKKWVEHLYDTWQGLRKYGHVDDFEIV